MNKANVIRCPSCGIRIGAEFTEKSLINFRGEEICDWCVREWKRREAIVGHELSFDKMIKGIKGGKGNGTNSYNPENFSHP